MTVSNPGALPKCQASICVVTESGFCISMGITSQAVQAMIDRDELPPFSYVVNNQVRAWNKSVFDRHALNRYEASRKPTETESNEQNSPAKSRVKRGRKRDPKIRTRNKEIAKYKANNSKKTWKEIGDRFGESADVARKACNNPDN